MGCLTEVVRFHYAYVQVNHAAPLAGLPSKDSLAFFSDAGLALVSLQQQRNMLFMEKIEDGIVPTPRSTEPVVRADAPLTCLSTED